MKKYDFRMAPFELHGVPNWDGKREMERVPESVVKQLECQDFMPSLARRCPGARLCFRTDSKNVAFTIELESISVDIGMSIYSCQSGNMYVGDRQTARYAGLVKPIDGYNSTTCKGSLEKSDIMEDIVLYLPRNEHVKSIEIELDDDAKLEAPTPYKYQKPLMFYGSSITEGGCCSKPANAYNAIVARHLDADYYNFGFSGSARGEIAMADYINTIDKSVFILDYDHNSPSADHLRATHEKFFKRIREHDPLMPIIIMSRPDFDFWPECAERRDIVRATYENAIAAGDKNVYFIDGETLFGTDDRMLCSNDCIHPNDLGMYRMAQAVEPVVRRVVRAL